MNIARRFRRAVTPMSQSAREHAYLEDSVSLTDLERRQKEIDRGLLRLRRFGY